MRLSEICKILNLDYDGGDFEVSGLNSLGEANESELSYCDGVKNKDSLQKTKAGIVLVQKELIEFVPKSSNHLISSNPHLNFAILSRYFAKDLVREKRASNIDSSAKIMQNVYIGSNSKIGRYTTIMPGAYIGDDVMIGDECIIHPNVVIYNDTIIGNRCYIQANSVIGSEGFGYAHTKDGSHIKIYHNGNVKIEDDVEIGANTTIDRAVFGTTTLKKGTKIDNLVQIGHNCELGENCLMAAHAGLAGSTILGKNVTMGGQSASSGHLKVGDFATIAGRGGVTKNLQGGKVYGGFPAVELKEWLRKEAKINQILKEKK
ncbi:UDP-3-O-(R-3-hydroxymyristoyl)-glucosamine N-acyltransferase [Campylobacter blaseri]|uniref:UDP-3-O-acylglucosamine N-acyltransferase n=1 Tax=Campylobacter blaseri TaxID=2042961 RepID=A0A2P8R2P8_9BACT|nr:UDP-3-O-(3-hydroxymyristoyl)glucosamine N-acyltransferase [Campylobacter blaseri]PSM52760.1 UDP-3-O-(3-hydroxymyristoyl)glucosamine N-acyltransferase [Campylobacter blaseri]PSM54408.1 UDP-3-O-(3-hydroxymyristoyl)glucosamine N-acyltransferase [Campylobacter blaseri]QKF86070.1 UDP-3-O-(R-3-hydroxymyristoyl)-glucosamine N-acyltransferase [Campylobacter blaseri]